VLRACLFFPRLIEELSSIVLISLVNSARVLRFGRWKSALCVDAGCRFGVAVVNEMCVLELRDHLWLVADVQLEGLDLDVAVGEC